MTKTIIKDGIEINKNWITIRRGKAFSSKTTTPRDWEYRGEVKRIAAYTTAGTHCELCGTELVWSYALRHKKINDVLWVGSECIKWYYEAWQPPNGLQMLLDAMKNDTAKAKKEYIAEKLDDWSKQYPRIYKYLMGKEAYEDCWLRCPVVNSETGMKEELKVRSRMFRASLKRKGYLNEDQMAMLYGGLKRSSKTYYPDKLDFVPTRDKPEQTEENVGL